MPSTSASGSSARVAASKASYGSSHRSVAGRSLGAVLLSRVAQTNTQIAMRVGAARCVVARWKRGQRVPGDHHYRRLLEEAFGIPAESWDQPAVSSASSTSSEAFSFAWATQQLRRQVERMLESAERHAAAGDYRTADRVMRDGVAAIVLLGRITGESLDLSSEQAVRLSSVRRFVDRLIDALRHCPKGLRLVIAALEGDGDR